MLVATEPAGPPLPTPTISRLVAAEAPSGRASRKVSISPPGKTKPEPQSWSDQGQPGGRPDDTGGWLDLPDGDFGIDCGIGLRETPAPQRLRRRVMRKSPNNVANRVRQHVSVSPSTDLDTIMLPNRLQPELVELGQNVADDLGTGDTGLVAMIVPGGNMKHVARASLHRVAVEAVANAS